MRDKVFVKDDMLEIKRLILVFMAMLVFALPKPAMGQIFPADNHTLQNGIYEIYYSTSSLDAASKYHIYVMAKLPDIQTFFLTSVGGDTENIRGKEEDKIVMWSPLLEGKTPDDYSFEIYAIDDRILEARIEGKTIDAKNGFGKVRLESNLEDAVFKLNGMELDPAIELTLPEGTYCFRAEAKDLPQIEKNHTARRDQSSTVVLHFAIGYLTTLINMKDRDVRRVTVKPIDHSHRDREIKQRVKHMFSANDYIVSVELKDGSKKDLSVSLYEGDSKSLRIDFAKIDIPGYAWTKEIESNIVRRLTEIQAGLFFNDDYRGYTLSIPLTYTEKRAPIGHGTYFTGSLSALESIGILHASSKYGNRIDVFADFINLGMGLAYASPNLYNISTMVKVGGCVQPHIKTGIVDKSWIACMDIDFALNKYLKNHKNFRINLRYRLLDTIEESDRHYFPVYPGTLFINFGFNFFEFPVPR